MIDISKTRFLDNGIIDVLNDFLETTKEKKINVKVIIENEVLDNPKNMNPMYQYKRKSA